MGLSVGWCLTIWTIASSSWHLNHKNIPRPACAACSSRLESILHRVVNNLADLAAWDLSYILSMCIGTCLKLWTGHTVSPNGGGGGGRKRNLGFTIIKCIDARWDDDEANIHPFFIHPLRDPTSSKLPPVSVKLKDGNITSAVQILCSNEVIADFSIESLTKLHFKHPAEPKIRRSHQSCPRTQSYKLVKRMCFAPFIHSRQAIEKSKWHQSSSAFEDDTVPWGGSRFALSPHIVHKHSPGLSHSRGSIINIIGQSQTTCSISSPYHKIFLLT